MDNFEIITRAITEFLSAYGFYLLAVACASCVVLSLIFKPIFKKALNSRRDRSLILIEDVKELYNAEVAKSETNLSATDFAVVKLKQKAYEKQIAEYAEVIGEKWFSDKLSQGCFAFLTMLCFVGTGIYFALATGLSHVLSASYFLSAATTVCVAEMLYSAYEEFGLKKLYKLISEKLK